MMIGIAKVGTSLLQCGRKEDQVGQIFGDIDPMIWKSFHILFCGAQIIIAVLFVLSPMSVQVNIDIQV